MRSCDRLPMQHPDVREILLIGFYPQSQEMNRFIEDMQRKYGLPIRYMYIQPTTASTLYCVPS